MFAFRLLPAARTRLDFGPSWIFPEFHALASDLIFRMHRGSPLFLLAGLFLARLLSSGTHIIHQTWPATTCFLGRSLGRSFLTWRKLLRFLASFFPRVSLLPGWFTCHCILQILDCRFQTMFHAAVAILLRESAALLSSRSVNKLARVRRSPSAPTLSPCAMTEKRRPASAWEGASL